MTAAQDLLTRPAPLPPPALPPSGTPATDDRDLLLDLPGRHRRAARTAAARSPGAVVCQLSAALLHGLPVVGSTPGRVQLLRPGAGPGAGRPGAGRPGAGRPRAAPELVAADLVLLDGVRVTSMARTVVDVARTAPLATAVVLADAALHARAVSAAQVGEVLLRSRGAPGWRAALRALRRVDGRSGEPAASLARLALQGPLGRRAGLPAPLCAVEIRDDDGHLVGGADLALPDVRLLLRCRRDDVAPTAPDDQLLAALGWRVLVLGPADRARPGDPTGPGSLVDRVRRAADAGPSAGRPGSPRGTVTAAPPLTLAHVLVG